MPIPYNASNVSLARNLRKKMTLWERKLWFGFLKNHPLRWQRQKPILNYIVDFYCAEAKLALELDGSEHHYPSKQLDDDERTRAIESIGITVCRFANNEIDKHFVSVCDEINRLVGECAANKATNHPQSAFG
ncbi:endonuclease domain-containing protein [Bifidobacterium panos]|uniref:endonuclease domain-containing protein n=1 Tax=Bifidobacterium panos TaxID=2675321 RepID=UPI001C131DCC|nr:endonuclease domain-containing protein [Bifidobacterium sp. DSM 109963]